MMSYDSYFLKKNCREYNFKQLFFFLLYFPRFNHQSRSSSAKLVPTSVSNSSGGSLPDLTQVQFIQPMPNPLPDIDAIVSVLFGGLI